MNFKEFIEKEEKELFEQGLDEVIGSGLKFIGGVGGNLISQSGRSIGNMAKGLSQGAIGAGQGVLGSLQMASGGGQKGRETFRKGLSNLGSGIGNLARGATQAGGVLSGVSPILRGAQASSEPLGLSGVYAPGSKNRTYTQDLLGLDSWEKPKPEEKKEIEVKPLKVKDSETSSFLKDLGRKEKEEEWEGLVDRYKSAKTSAEREEIRNKIRRHFPSFYMQAVQAGERKRKSQVTSP
jgi:hypothetical protein